MDKLSVHIIILSCLILHLLTTSVNAQNKPDCNTPIECELDTLATQAMAKHKTHKDSMVILANELLEKSQKHNYHEGILQAYAVLAEYEVQQDKVNDAIAILKKALQLHGDREETFVTATIKNNLSILFKEIGQYPEAIEYGIIAARFFENNMHPQNSISSYNNLAIVSYYLEDINKAEEYFLMAKEVAERHNFEDNILEMLNNLGIIYRVTEQYEKAIDSYILAFEYARKLKRNKVIITIYTNMANVYIDQENFKLAEKYFNDAINFLEEIGNKRQAVNVYVNLGRMHLLTNNLDKAHQCFEISRKLAIESEYTEGLTEVYLKLMNLFELRNDYHSALNFHKKYVALNDSIRNVKNAEKAKELEAAYQNEKKTKKINELNHEKEIQALESERKTLQNYALSGGIFIALIFIFFIYKGLKEKKKANEILASQKGEIQQQNQQLSEKNLIIEGKHKEITDSINYAQRIQEALLNPGNQRIGEFKEQFVYFRPKDIVSGDFYWSIKSEDKHYFCVADCTGHGVPGAFMSMLGISYLNEIIQQNSALEPAEILNLLRKKIKNNLGSNGKTKDGMDISLISLQKVNDPKNESDSAPHTHTVSWAGANNPLWVIRKGSDTIEEIKGDKQPIGFHFNETPFTNHKLELKAGDTLYLFSDGYYDQFGGEGNRVGGKKFKSNNFKKLLLSIQEKPLSEQHDYLDEIFINWKGELEQVDDVCVIGVRI